MKPEELRQAMTLAPRNKYSVAPVAERTLDGVVFASKGEMIRWCDLLLLAKAGEISEPTRQVKFVFIVRGVNVGAYVADFAYTIRATNEHVVEDWKGYRKGSAYSLFRLKAKLMLAIFGITIKETGYGQPR